MKTSEIATIYVNQAGVAVAGNKPAFAIFSLPIGDDSIFGKPEDLISEVLECSVKKVKGCYKDVVENSYLVLIPDNPLEAKELVEGIEVLCKVFGEESFLLVNSQRKALLCYVDEVLDEHIGNFVKVSAAEAVNSGNWTLDGSQFWMCK